MPIESIPFNEVFDFNSETEVLKPKVVISVNGVVVGPGVSFDKGASIAGVDFRKYKDLNLAAENENGVLIMKGYFQKP